MSGTWYSDLYVDTNDPEGLDKILMGMKSVLIMDTTVPNAYYIKQQGHYIARVFGDTGYVKFVLESQGYAKVIGVCRDIH